MLCLLLLRRLSSLSLSLSLSLSRFEEASPSSPVANCSSGIAAAAQFRYLSAIADRNIPQL